MADTLDVRIAHLEGGYEQIDKRLGSLEARLSTLEATVKIEIGSLRTELRDELRLLRQETREQFRWIIGFQIATMLSLIGTLLAVFLRQ